jgi:hypothetical protein
LHEEVDAFVGLLAEAEPPVQTQRRVEQLEVDGIGSRLLARGGLGHRHRRARGGGAPRGALPDDPGTSAEIEAVLDTGFTGPLTLPPKVVPSTEKSGWFWLIGGGWPLQNARPFGGKLSEKTLISDRNGSAICSPDSSPADYGHPVPVPVKMPEFETRASTVGAGASRAALFAFASF